MSSAKAIHGGVSLVLALVLSVSMVPAAWAEGLGASGSASSSSQNESTVTEEAPTAEGAQEVENPNAPEVEAPAEDTDNSVVQPEQDESTTSDSSSLDSSSSELQDESSIAAQSEAAESQEESITAQAAVPSNIDVNTSAHVQSIGWQRPVTKGATAGTTGRKLRVEALKMELSQSGFGSISYSAYVADSGWSTGQDNSAAGTTGQSRAIEAIKVQLSGDVATAYDVYYRAHVSHVGWLDWASNGQKAGSAGYGNAIEAVQVVLVAKGAAAPGPTANPYKSLGSLTYSAHVENIGWQSSVADGRQAGTTGKGLRVEALRVAMPSSDLSGDVEYNAHVQGIGWQGAKTNGAVAGTVGQGKRTEALKINLTGQKAQTYDIYYRVHVQNYGWLDWACNGQEAGTTGLSFRVEAVEIRLVNKGDAAPGATARPSISKATATYSTHVQRIGWQSPQTNGATAGTTGRGLRVEALKMNLNSNIPGGIKYSSHIRNIGWQDWASNGSIAGTVGQSLQCEAIKIQLTGEAAKYYDVYYRVHAQEYGWMGWAKNGEKAGTASVGYRMEAVQVVLVGKGGNAPGSTANAYTNKPAMHPAVARMLSLAQQYSSPSRYLLMVDTDDTKTCVFEGSRGNWRLKYAWDCGSGAPATPTILGVFSVGIKGYSFGEQWGYSCYYYTQFCGDYLFHTGLYYANTWNPMDIGMNIRNSHGCVRLDPPNAKWIWDNVPQGTTVVTIV